MQITSGGERGVKKENMDEFALFFKNSTTEASFQKHSEVLHFNVFEFFFLHLVLTENTP